MFAPFPFDKGRHIAAGAMFSFERTVVRVDHQRAYIVHEARVALDLGGIREILREDEVQIALKCVAENNAFCVAMLAQQDLQIQRRRSQ